jgi:hypothetical protein
MPQGLANAMLKPHSVANCRLHLKCIPVFDLSVEFENQLRYRLQAFGSSSQSFTGAFFYNNRVNLVCVTLVYVVDPLSLVIVVRGWYD